MSGRNDKLSNNFCRHEFRCRGEKCCGGSAPVDMELVRILQLLSNHYGIPIIVHSGFRCLVHNRRIGSKDTSQHPLARAADVEPDAPIDLRGFASMARGFMSGRGGIGLYLGKNFVHIDVRDEPFVTWGDEF